MLVEKNKQEEKWVRIPEHLPRIWTYSMAISELIVSYDGKSDKLWEEKFIALRKTWSLLEWYASDFFDEKILDTIMEKKARKILDAASVKKVRELSDPPKPYYTGNRWIVSENSVPEEEMIWWSKASQRAPLNAAAFRRFMKLFQEFYGVDPGKIMENGGKVE